MLGGATNLLRGKISLRWHGLLIAGLTAAVALMAWWLSVDEQKIRLRPVSFAEIEGWQDDDHAAALSAFIKSAQADRKLRYGEAAILLGEKASREAARRFFEDLYTPYAVEDAEEEGLVTGYYEPEVNGSRQPNGEFQVPVYRRPDDLVQVKPDLLRALYNDGHSVRRRAGEKLVPYYTRAEIDAGALEGKGLELLYLDDPVELFFMQIQGSGRVRLTDGSWVRLGYAAKNGHKYRSIGKLLAERGEKPPGGLTMEGLKSWLRADPARGRALMHENASYVFFRELPREKADDGPVGAQGAPLTPGRSLAVDAAYHALGTPIFVAAPKAPTPDGKPFRRL
ncbi:MAG TPA: MltA domain-containing protein, partial [Methyloceanibacter sp.]|nr:MltA domain-containing protein [Methyloceanibacter sp.]